MGTSGASVVGCVPEDIGLETNLDRHKNRSEFPKGIKREKMQ